MVPTLEPGWFVLVDPSRRGVPGDVVVAQHPGDPELVLIKRLAHRQDDDAVWLSSDNVGVGSDSRQFGPIAPDLVAGRVTLVLDEPRRPLRYTPADARRDRRE
jgi:nickel-type superoxide dismutase maturation protease